MFVGEDSLSLRAEILSILSCPTWKTTSSAWCSASVDSNDCDLKPNKKPFEIILPDQVRTDE